MTVNGGRGFWLEGTPHQFFFWTSPASPVGIGAIVRVIAFSAFFAFLAPPMLPAGAQTGLVDLNTAVESDLQKLPHMTPAIVKGLTEKRPFPTILELNQFLLDQKLTAEQARELYGKAFVKINLNSGKREDFLLIPRVWPPS